MSDSNTEEPLLDKVLQVKYWKRCLRSLLPHHYTGNESNRMYLAFFMISALDLLDAWHTVTNETERREYVDWIYHCQHPQGGFRMWPGTDFGERSNEANAKWDPANLPATYFALSSLLIMGDDLKRVHRVATQKWLKRMQRSDGSFGETLVDGHIAGGSDPRFGYCAAGVRHILRGSTDQKTTFEDEVESDVDIDSFVEYVQRAESHDGGIADEKYHEPHAGYTFCALGALKFLDRLAIPSDSRTNVKLAPLHPQLTLKWLSTRQTDMDDPEEALDSEFVHSKGHGNHGVDKIDSPNSEQPRPSGEEDLAQPGESDLGLFDAGMNGRLNKVSDTCYAFWGGASFHVMQHPQLYDHILLRRYLLGKTQHTVVGGFGKFPGDPPDLYHSYMALAALGISGCEDVKPVDATLCISSEASSRVTGLWQD